MSRKGRSTYTMFYYYYRVLTVLFIICIKPTFVYCLQNHIPVSFLKTVRGRLCRITTNTAFKSLSFSGSKKGALCSDLIWKASFDSRVMVALSYHVFFFWKVSLNPLGGITQRLWLWCDGLLSFYTHFKFLKCHCYFIRKHRSSVLKQVSAVYQQVFPVISIRLSFIDWHVLLPRYITSAGLMTAAEVM